MLRERLARLFALLPAVAADERLREVERLRQARLAQAASLVSKTLSMLVLFFGMSLTLPYLGADRFGVWMVIASLASCLTFLDLGIGNALTGHIARVLAQDCPEAVREIVSAGVGLLAVIGAGASLLLFAMVSLVSWEHVTHLTDPELLREMRLGAQVFALLFGISLFGTGMQRIYAGLQQAHWGHLASAVGSLLALLALVCAARWQLDIPALLIATFGLQSLLPLILLPQLVWQGLCQRAGLIAAMRRHRRVMLRSGGLFLVLQLGPVLASAVDPLLVSATLGVTAVAMFSVVQRLSQLISQPLALLNAPLWAAYADAQARGDLGFIRRTLIRSLLGTTVLGLLAATLLWLVRDWILPFWTKGVVVVPDVFLAWFVFWVVCDAIDNAFAMFLNGCNLVVPQVTKVVTFALIALPLKWVLVERVGLFGIPLSSLLAYVVSICLCYGLIYRRRLISTLWPADV